MIISENVFVGISLHNKYFSKRNISTLLKYSYYWVNELLFLVADSLNRYNYMLKFRINEKTAVKKSHIEGEQVLNMLFKIISDNKITKPLITIKKWDEYVPFISDVQNNLEYLLKHNPMFRNDLTILSQKYLKDKIGLDYMDSDSIKISSKYIIEEMAISIYISEYTKYHCEIYPGEDIGLVNEIYSNKYGTNILNSILNNKLQERQYFSLKFE